MTPELKKKKKKRSALGSSSGLNRASSSSSKTRAVNASSSTINRRKLGLNDLPWRSVKTSSLPAMDAGGGMMMLEELDGVDIEWEQGDDGRKVASFMSKEGEEQGRGKGGDEARKEAEETGVERDEEVLVKQKQKGKGKEKKEENKLAKYKKSKGQVIVDEDKTTDDLGLPSFADVDVDDLDDEVDDFFDDDILPEWKSVQLHPALKRALHHLGFSKPTNIQNRALPPALIGHDVIGVAETGSGKTLAYSLPILSHLLDNSPIFVTPSRRPLSALVLCPTRELAIQVSDQLSKVVAAAIPPTPGSPPRISIGSVVGGLSAHKQKRIVDRGCDILVATPGRLWDLMKADDELAAGVRSLKFLVIDEADRMIENGHFAELESIIQLTRRTTLQQTDEAEEDDPTFAGAETTLTKTEAKEDMQTFIFSATMAKELQQNLKRRKRPGKSKHKNGSTLEDLVDRLDFRDENPTVIDLSPQGGVVSILRESMVECINAEKDLYLYYFLLRYPGRTIVFVGSIDGIRRLIPLFEALNQPVFPLHSQLQQKQRLKNLDRFKQSSHAVLFATDVAARGLDVPNVDHVIHFNLPRTADAYIHRSGRTARASNTGFALQIVSPEERGMQRALMKTLNREPPAELEIEYGFLPKLRERIELARKIEKAQHNVKKMNHDRNWLREAAEAMDVDIDPTLLSDEEDPDAPVNRQTKANSSKNSVSYLKAQLAAHLARPLIARGVSARYPTSGSVVVVDAIVGDTAHTEMIGAGTKKAYDVAGEVMGRKEKSKVVGSTIKLVEDVKKTKVKSEGKVERSAKVKAKRMSRHAKIAARITG